MEINLKELASDMLDYIDQDLESMKNDPAYANAEDYRGKLFRLREHIKACQVIIAEKDKSMILVGPNPTPDMMADLPKEPKWVTEALGGDGSTEYLVEVTCECRVIETIPVRVIATNRADAMIYAIHDVEESPESFDFDAETIERNEFEATVMGLSDGEDN